MCMDVCACVTSVYTSKSAKGITSQWALQLWAHWELAGSQELEMLCPPQVSPFLAPAPQGISGHWVPLCPLCCLPTMPYPTNALITVYVSLLLLLWKRSFPLLQKAKLR